ncbi:MAG TPA: type I methionyl aminopeptidase [Acidimicrobiales bacterium]|nr:type I methionyl aminopeptidase [Acidimicrobiales bacterium]
MTAPKANELCWCGSGRKYKRCHRASQDRVRPGELSPGRSVPAGIPRPDYADTGRPVRTTEPLVKGPDLIAAMRRAGRIAAEVLGAVGAAVAPGVTTDALDVICHEECLARGAYPSPLNYHGYPKSVCTSVNEVICHGIPDSRPLAEGDIVNIDVTAFIDGVHGDTNATYPVGRVDPESARLIEATRTCLELGIAAVRPGRPVSDIGRAIEGHAHSCGFGVVRAFVGHGVGTVFHNGLVIPHFYDPTADTVMEPGMTFTIEPMITAGAWQHRMWEDGWTAVTVDGRRTAQFEHTILVTDDGAEVLTA